jgi:superfamily II DNA or RNA helicase/transcriptional regulator with XRE-family HTH domain
MRQSPIEIPSDYPSRVRNIRTRLDLTQMRLAEQIGVSFATVNRWENGQARPTRLAWQQILDLESAVGRHADGAAATIAAATTAPTLDFAGNPVAVAAVAEAKRLGYGYLFNGAFATETSLIDPLPHQRIAVYEHMLGLSPLRFLLADDAGAGKTIMTGLYVREMLARRLISRVLVVPPAGLVGNWEREMRTLFRLPFRIVRGAEARTGNPFTGPDSDRLIVSIDTLAGERMFGRLREAVISGAARPYDLVVFDEAHKLSADREQDFYVRKTDRYCLAEALAGLPSDGPRWQLGWSAANILLLTATPHMGKDFPYYALWRLLAPDALPTFDAFQAFPVSQRRRHFIRRTKEEMVRFDGQPLYPQRQCDTLGYPLSPEEQLLYDATTQYIDKTYNQARILNRSAARLAMSVFQRRQASSTYALMRSFERRLARLDEAIELVRSGRDDELEQRQRRIVATPDIFETRTADEDSDETGERHEEFEEAALGGVIALTLADLQSERATVDGLLDQARRLAETGEDSKFEKLREVLRDPCFAREKFIVFTEHRDTAEFLVRRLEGLGFTGHVALIHGGLDYREREAQVELFRRSLDEGGANYLVATDAAGEGINLQFCWLMVNYDVPWNPARLEQRMGRIHRYGQKRDPVVIVNLVARDTREGRVLKVLLDKLEAIRKELRSDKVFDVVGRLFQNVSLSAYLQTATTEDGERAAVDRIGSLTAEQVRALEERERALFGGGDVRSHLPALNGALEQEQYRRLLPGYVRRFVESAAPLTDLELEGDPDGIFDLVPQRPRGLDPVLSGIEFYSAELRRRFTVYRPQGPAAAIWVHPGEPVFDHFCDALLSRRSGEARRGAIFVDPHARESYLFHLAEVSVLRRRAGTDAAALFPNGPIAGDGLDPDTVEARLIGLRQERDGSIARCPLEHLLLLRGASGAAPGGVPLARLARELTDSATQWLRNDALAHMVEDQRARIESALPERLDWIVRGYDYKTAELMAARRRANDAAMRGDQRAAAELARIKEQQRQLAAEKERRLAQLRAEPSRIIPGEAVMLAHALVLPADDPEERKRHDAEVEAIAMQLAQAHEEAAGAAVHDVSRPDLAVRAGLTERPGFDLRSLRPASVHGPAEERAIEVKGRATTGAVEVTENEWAKACNLRDRYWLYVVFGCATSQPRLVKVRDPFGRLLAKAKGSMLINATDIVAAAHLE